MTRNVGRSCYVTVFQAPLAVWKAYHRGIYDEAKDGELAGLIVRLGAYGDPAAVPFHVWDRALINSAGHNGYTHQWRDYPDSQRIAWPRVTARRIAFKRSFSAFARFVFAAKPSRNCRARRCVRHRLKLAIRRFAARARRVVGRLRGRRWI